MKRRGARRLEARRGQHKAWTDDALRAIFVPAFLIAADKVARAARPGLADAVAL